MLSGIYHATGSNLPGVWELWVKHIMKREKDLGFDKAAMFQNNGKVAATWKGFSLSSSDIRRLNEAFEDNNNNTERVRILGKSYIVKSMSEDQLVAFNGSKYLIVCKSKTMLIVTICVSRSKIQEASDWLMNVCRQLAAKNY